MVLYEEPCRCLWSAAITVYVADVRRYERYGNASDQGEAWLDFHSQRYLLARLTDALDLDLAAVVRYVALEINAVR